MRATNISHDKFSWIICSILSQILSTSIASAHDFLSCDKNILRHDPQTFVEKYLAKNAQAKDIPFPSAEACQMALENIKSDTICLPNEDRSKYSLSTLDIDILAAPKGCDVFLLSSQPENVAGKQTPALTQYEDVIYSVMSVEGKIDTKALHLEPAKIRRQLQLDEKHFPFSGENAPLTPYNCTFIASQGGHVFPIRQEFPYRRTLPLTDFNSLNECLSHQAKFNFSDMFRCEQQKYGSWRANKCVCGEKEGEKIVIDSSASTNCYEALLEEVDFASLRSYLAEDLVGYHWGKSPPESMLSEGRFNIRTINSDQNYWGRGYYFAPKLTGTFNFISKVDPKVVQIRIPKGTPYLKLLDFETLATQWHFPNFSKKRLDLFVKRYPWPIHSYTRTLDWWVIQQGDVPGITYKLFDGAEWGDEQFRTEYLDLISYDSWFDSKHLKLAIDTLRSQAKDLFTRSVELWPVSKEGDSKEGYSWSISGRCLKRSATNKFALENVDQCRRLFPTHTRMVYPDVCMETYVGFQNLEVPVNIYTEAKEIKQHCKIPLYCDVNGRLQHITKRSSVRDGKLRWEHLPWYRYASREACELALFSSQDFRHGKDICTPIKFNGKMEETIDNTYVRKNISKFYEVKEFPNFIDYKQEGQEEFRDLRSCLEFQRGVSRVQTD